MVPDAAARIHSVSPRTYKPGVRPSFLPAVFPWLSNLYPASSRASQSCLRSMSCLHSTTCQDVGGSGAKTISWGPSISCPTKSFDGPVVRKCGTLAQSVGGELHSQSVGTAELGNPSPSIGSPSRFLLSGRVLTIGSDAAQAHQFPTQGDNWVLPLFTSSRDHPRLTG